MSTPRPMPSSSAQPGRRFAMIAAAALCLLAALPADGVKIRSRDELIGGTARDAGDTDTEFRTQLEEPLAGYIEAVRLIQRGNVLRGEGKLELAMPSYRQALRNLERIEQRYPDWRPEMRAYRQTQCQQIIGAVGQARAGKVLTIRDEVEEELPKGPKIVGRGPRRSDEPSPAGSGQAPSPAHAPARSAPAPAAGAGPSGEAASPAAHPAPGLPAAPEMAPAPGGGEATEGPAPSELAAIQQHLEQAIRERDGLRSQNAILERELESVGARLEELERELLAAGAQAAPAAAAPQAAPQGAEPQAAAAEELPDQRAAEAQAAYLRAQLQKEREIATLRATLARAIGRLRELDPTAADEFETSVRPAPPAP